MRAEHGHVLGESMHRRGATEATSLAFLVLLAHAGAARSGDPPAERPEPDEAWRAEAERTAGRFRAAIRRGAAAGKRARVFVEVGGRIASATVASADERRLVVDAGGAQIPIPWETLGARRLYYVGLKYVDADRAKAHGALAIYCAVHGLLDEAEKEARLALNQRGKDAEAIDALLDFLRAARSAEAAANAAKARRSSKPKSAKGKDGAGTLGRAEYLRTALSFDAVAMHKRLGPDWAHFHPEEDGDDPPEIPQRRSDGQFLFKQEPLDLNQPTYKQQRGGKDWTGMAGQVLYAPLEPRNPGVDRIRFCWSFHEGHGGSQFWHVYLLAPNITEWYCKSPDPCVNRDAWKALGGGPLANPVAVARAKVSWSNCGIIVFRSGVIGATGYGNNDDRYPCTRLPPGKVPTAVAVTPNNEFALVTVWDLKTLEGSLAVVALEARALEHHSWYYAGMPSVGTYTRLKVMGLVDLPGMSAPTAVSATGDVSRWRWASNVSKERLDSQAVRDRWASGGDEDHLNCRSGYALVASRSEDKVAVVDLGPLYRYMRSMYFTTQENYDKTTNEGPAPDEWPFTFDVAPEAKPRVVKTIPVPRPTVVAAGLANGRSMRNRDFLTKAYVGTEDGRLVVLEMGALVGKGAPSGVGPVGVIRIGRNPTSVAYGRHGAIQDDLVIVCRGDRGVVWVRTSGNSGEVVRRLRDSRLADPVAAELWDSRGAAGVSVADFRGRRIVNYLYQPINSWGERLFGGAGEDGQAEFECTGTFDVPGHPFMLSSAEVN